MAPAAIALLNRHGIQLKIISGGQTGADRAALDFAIEHNIAHGGWCPKGRRAEDGPIPKRYQLRETPGTDYSQRTEWNVRDSDGTVILGGHEQKYDDVRCVPLGLWQGATREHTRMGL